MTVLDVTTTRQAGAAPTPPVRPVVGSQMPAEDWKERTWQKAEYLFLRDFLLFFPRHPSLLACPTVSCNSCISLLWISIRVTSIQLQAPAGCAIP